MRPRIPRCHLLFMAVFLAATPVFSQNLCLPSDTMARCFERYKIDTKKTVDQERDALEDQPSGIDTGGTSLDTNSKDFSPLMALAALLGQGTSDGSGTLNFEQNFHLPVDSYRDSHNAQLQAVVNTASEISGALRDALHTAQHDELLEPLEKQIGSLDDFKVRFTYNYTSSSYGRDFEQHMDDFEKMCDAAERERSKDAAGAMNELRKQLDPSGESDPTFERMRPTTIGWRNMLESAEGKAAEVVSPLMRNISSYHLLMANQPQLHFMVENKFREPLIGPDELSVKLTWEWSNVNLNAATDGCEGWGWGSPECLDKYTESVNGWGEKKIAASHRFSFSGEYVDIDGETVDFKEIDPMFPAIDPVVLEPVHKLVLSLGWSRNVLLSAKEPVKLDLKATYEDVSDDPLRQDRGIATLTVTRQVGKMSIPFGIVYANHGEFLSDVDARLSAHIGLRFKMMPES